MTTLSILQNLYGFSFGVALTVVICVCLVVYPEKFEKWASMIAWVVSRVWKKAEYFAIKSEVQGKINSFVRTLESNTTTQFPLVSIRWAGREKEELIWEEGEAIIVMRDRKHKTKNFVHAAYFFTSEALLRKSKRHLSKSQKISFDLYATKKILECESKASVEQFMNDYFVPEVERQDDVRNLIQQFVHIDRIGIFFPILIQELSYLGNKVFLEKPTSEVIEEVKFLVAYLENFAQREVGSISTPDTFVGKYTRCAIKIIASRQVRERGDITSHKESVSKAIRNGLENIYIIGSAQDKNREFMDYVANAICSEYNYIQLLKTYQFKGQIKMHGELTNVKTYLIYLHNPNAVKYLYEQNDVESLVQSVSVTAN